VLAQNLRVEIDEMRQVLAEQLQAQGARQTAALMGQHADMAQYIRAARLLIQPGRKLTQDMLRALGVPPPSSRVRPSEHYARSIATLVLPALGFEIVVSRGAHPDLICRYEDRYIGVEVEVGLVDYDAHGHDAADSHVVVCWTPPTTSQVIDGYFTAKRVSNGYSPRLAVVTLQTPQLYGSPFAAGAKRFAYTPDDDTGPLLVRAAQ